MIAIRRIDADDWKHLRATRLAELHLWVVVGNAAARVAYDRLRRPKVARSGDVR